MQQAETRTSEKIKAFFQHPDFIFWGAMVLWFILILMFVIFIGVIFSECIHTVVSDWLGTKEFKDKAPKLETLRFIGWGMGGMIVAIGAVAINRRASAEVKIAEAQEESNKLIEKGHDNYRFQNMIGDLGHDKMTVRIATFYRFYYLASKKVYNDNFRKDVFEILCSCLRALSSSESDSKEKTAEHRMELQTLFDILFKDKFKTRKNGLISNSVPADLQRIDLAGINFTNANLSSVNFEGANISDVNLSGVILSGAILSGVNLSNMIITHADFSHTKLCNTDLSNSILWDTNFSYADFWTANLSDSSLLQSDFSYANFSHATLSRVDFSGAQLKGAKLWNAHYIEKTNFRGAKMGNRAIQHSDLPEGMGTPIMD